MRLITKSCEHCGKRFASQPIYNRRFCSHQCYGLSLRVPEAHIKATCLSCKKDFTFLRSQLAGSRTAGIFCSRKCFFDYRKGENACHWTGGKVSKKCNICGNTYKTNPGRVPQKKYCSRKCYDLAQTGKGNSRWLGGKKIKRLCKTCGKTFNIYPHQAAGGWGIFCSNPCSAIYTCKHHMKNKHTKIEISVAKMLDKLGIKYTDQHPIPEGRTVVDFYIPEQRLVIYADGDYWHSLPERKNKDQTQDFLLEMNGYEVLRLSETEIKKHKQKCINKIKKALPGRR